MEKEKAEMAIGMCVISLTRYIMARQQVGYEEAYRKLLSTELYQLLQDAETRLFLEADEYLQGAYDTETFSGKDALYSYINSGI